MTVPGMWEAYGGEWGEFDGEAVFRKVDRDPRGARRQGADAPSRPAGRFRRHLLGWRSSIGQTDINVAAVLLRCRASTSSRPEQTKAGRHVLAVRIFDHKGGGGFNSTPADGDAARPPR